MVSSDSGVITTQSARHTRVKESLATAGWGLSYAVAAQRAHPDRQDFAVGGDGN
jgi:thiamine pyrophosphate-dependent acetolactate synthase large subunit-like protein